MPAPRPCTTAAASSERIDSTVVIDALVAAGADVESRDNIGLTPLQAVVRRIDNPAVLSSLINFGDDSGDYANDGDCDDTRFGGDRGALR